MGRVSRYKKFKAIDPFSKTKIPEKTNRDEPPDVFDTAKSRRERLYRDNFDDENFADKEAQKEARRMIQIEERHRTNRKDLKKVEGKKDSETMKQFKKRVQRETQITLNEEIPKLMPSAKRRKEKLIERTKSKKKKQQTSGDEDDDDIANQEFHQAADGRLRPSDLGLSSSYFKKAEDVRFGEIADRPPDLSVFSKSLSSTIHKMNKRKQKDTLTEIHDSIESKEDEADTDFIDVNGERSPGERIKKRKKVKITEREDMFNGDGLEQASFTLPKDLTEGSNTTSNQNLKASVSIKHQEELELLREKAKLAYKSVQNKRRAERLANGK